MKAWVVGNTVYWSAIHGATQADVLVSIPAFDPATHRSQVKSVKVLDDKSVLLTHEIVALTPDKIDRTAARKTANAMKAKGENMNANDLKAAVIALLRLHADGA